MIRNPYVSRSGRVLDRDRDDLERADADRLALAHFAGLERRLVLHGPVGDDAHRVDPARRSVDRQWTVALEGEAQGVEAQHEIRPVVGVQVADQDRGQLVRRAMLEQPWEGARAGVDPDAGVILLDEVARAGGTGGRVSATRAEHCHTHS